MTRGDPIFELLLSPRAPPPMMVDSTFLDEMIGSVLRTASEQPATTTWNIVYDMGHEQKPKALVKTIEAPKDPVPTAATKAAVATEAAVTKEAPAVTEEVPAVTKEVPAVIKEASAATAEKVLDTVVSTLAEKERASGNFDPFAFSKRLVEHGNALLKEKNLPEDRRRLARRLTQTSPDHFHGPRLPLPVGCRKYRCLMPAYEQGAVSNACFEGC